MFSFFTRAEASSPPTPFPGEWQGSTWVCVGRLFHSLPEGPEGWAELRLALVFVRVCVHVCACTFLNIFLPGSFALNTMGNERYPQRQSLGRVKMSITKTFAEMLGFKSKQGSGSLEALVHQSSAVSEKWRRAWAC